VETSIFVINWAFWRDKTGRFNTRGVVRTSVVQKQFCREEIKL